MRLDLEELRQDSTVADLPSHDARAPGSALGQEIFEELERRPELPGILVDLEGTAVMISRGAFFQLISKGFGREIFLRRPVWVLCQALGNPALRIPMSSAVADAAKLALQRPLREIYEPLLLEGPSGVLRILDMHVLLLAQSQLLTLSNAVVAQKVEALEAANKALGETQAALVQSEKLASLGQLAAGVAHEINNPITFVSNNLSVLQREMHDLLALLDQHRTRLLSIDPAAAAALREVEEDIDLAYVQAHHERQFQASLEGLRRITDIVRNLCDFARLNQAEWQEFDLNAAVRSSIEILVYEKNKRMVQVQSQYGRLPPVEGHPGKINQVVLNIVLNALQACQRNGLVRVRTFAEAQSVCVEVADDGCGILPQDRSRLFDPFFTTKPVGEGTGLGLSISFGIVRDHGGTIEVESTPGQGSVFRVRLPVPARAKFPVVAMHSTTG